MPQGVPSWLPAYHAPAFLRIDASQCMHLTRCAKHPRRRLWLGVSAVHQDGPAKGGPGPALSAAGRVGAHPLRLGRHVSGGPAGLLRVLPGGGHAVAHRRQHADHPAGRPRPRARHGHLQHPQHRAVGPAQHARDARLPGQVDERPRRKPQALGPGALQRDCPPARGPAAAP